MSTKIYVAARVPYERFPEALKLMHDFLLERAYEAYLENMNSDEVKTAMEKRNLGEDVNIDRFRMYETSKLLLNFNKDYKMDLVACGLNVWFHNDNYAYIIPWGLPSIADSLTELIDEISWMEEYGYWNNTDHPEEIDEKEWDSRAKKWTEVGPNDNYVNFAKYRMCHTVCSADDSIGLLALEAHHREKIVAQN